MPPRQIHEVVWLVGSGTDEDAYTDSYDCHCYLVWDGAAGFLVDAGTGRAADQWWSNIADVCDPGRLDSVLLTHYHADHAGGAAFARDATVPVAAHPATVEALRTGDEDRTQLRRAREAGVYPADYSLRPADLESLSLGVHRLSAHMSVEVIDAPGHCDGHLVFLLHIGGDLLLFSGDCLFAGGKVSIQPIPDCRVDAYASTVIKLAERRPDALLPGHGELVLAGAADAAEKAADAFRRLIPPPNLLTPW